jgi:hypothetical protein
MSRGSYASIEIPRTFLTQEVMRVVRACVSHADDLSGQIIKFYNDNAPNGEFKDLENELIGLGIPFNRYTGQDFNIDSEFRYFRPEKGDSPKVDVTVLDHRECGEFVPAREIRKIIDLKPEDIKVKLQELLEEWAPSIQPLSEWE